MKYKKPPHIVQLQPRNVSTDISSSPYGHKKVELYIIKNR